MTIVEARLITGGVDTHAGTHVAAAARRCRSPGRAGSARRWPRAAAAGLPSGTGPRTADGSRRHKRFWQWWCLRRPGLVLHAGLLCGNNRLVQCLINRRDCCVAPRAPGAARAYGRSSWSWSPPGSAPWMPKRLACWMRSSNRTSSSSTPSRSFTGGLAQARPRPPI